MDAFSNQSVFQRLIKEQRAIPLDAAHGFALFFILTGIGAVIVNSVILLVLYFKRRNIFTNVFYIMILNFVLIDILKGACSIVWALKLLPGGASASILFMKVDQFALMILRFTNLATILNLLLITLNEFIFIVYPLRYGHIVTRIRVTMLIVFGWISSWLFTISLLLIGSHKQSVYIRPNCYPKDSTILNSTEHANISSCLVRSSRSLDSQFVFNVGVIVFCFICLLICVICYVILIRVIARIVRIDSKMLSNAQCSQNGLTGSLRK
ncbi:hypothetical protein AB6A40_004929 [Gnathostoma spinigerum]|uniref:G-protein coupled receptors family 1 profile domain-containing protein n=1 Tax=Gnathostoma spinigerum TaxID=75299 RepID=A0ABD6EF48_9BILA